jgi:hypothetical protein
MSLGGTDEKTIRLVRSDAKLVLPPAIPSEYHIALRQIPERLAHTWFAGTAMKF